MNVYTIYVSYVLTVMQDDTRIARISRWGQEAWPCPLTRPMVQKCQGRKGSIFGAQHQLPFSSALHPSQNAPHAKVWSVFCFSSGGLRERRLSRHERQGQNLYAHTFNGIILFDDDIPCERMSRMSISMSGCLFDQDSLRWFVEVPLALLELVPQIRPCTLPGHPACRSSQTLLGPPTVHSQFPTSCLPPAMALQDGHVGTYIWFNMIYHCVILCCKS